MLSDIGGVATLVGDPPNVIIASAAGFTFSDFLTHLAPIFIAWFGALFALWLIFRRELSRRPENIAGLMSLDEREALSDPVAARKVLIILGGVILLFFLHGMLHLTPAFVALAGAALPPLGPP